MMMFKSSAAIQKIGGAVVAVFVGLSTASHAQMMMLPGQFDVSPSGSALYTVPVETPPGTAGMSPAITLDYNSAGGNGLLGVGWNLGGLPSIGRCPQTTAQDGGIDGVSFDNNDRFCLDGQRLVVISGAYGAANSEYRTEIEGFTKVVAYGAAGNGPAYFRAWTKSGQVMEFGATSNSRLLAEGTSTVRSWAVNKISDTVGNYLTVTYNNDAANGQAYPTRIDYTGNAGEQLSPYNSVRFEYEARPDVIEKYVSGSVVKTTVRLKKIKTYEGANVVKSYDLTYGVGSSTNRSRVTQIKLCDGSGLCLPATSFSMTDADLGFPNQLSNPIAKADLDNIVLYTVDWNGDGVTDVMAWDPVTGNNTWFINDGALGFTKTVNAIPPTAIQGGSMIVGSWNGNEIADLMFFKDSSGENRWFVNDGSLNFTETLNPIPKADLVGFEIFDPFYIPPWLSFVDLNGDGITDMFWCDADTGNNIWYINDGALGFTKITNPINPSDIEPVNVGTIGQPFYIPGTMYVGDWNGDSVMDVVWLHGITKENLWYTNRNNGSVSFRRTSNPITNLGTGVGNLYDVNSDGVTDLVTFLNGGASIWYINDGALNFSQVADPVTPAHVSGNKRVFGDWNADDVVDVMFYNAFSGVNHWYINDGNLNFDYYANPIAPTSIAGTGALSIGDWNGDGFSEPMWHKSSDGSNIWFYDTDDAPDMLSSVTTGLGSTTSITYKPLTDATVYTKASDAVFPQIDIQAPFNVVSRVDADDGVGGVYSSEYAYAGAKIDLQGRGFLGFGEQTITDLQTSVEQKLTFLQDYPFIGFVETDEKSRLTQLLNRRTNTYLSDDLGGTRRFPYLEQVVEESNDLNGAAFPTVTTTYDYDAYGNATQIIVSNSVDSSTQTTTNTYLNDTTNWFLGRLTNATVTSFVSDTPPSGGGGPGDPGGGGAVQVVVVPLNGFTVIPLPSAAP